MCGGEARAPAAGGRSGRRGLQAPPAAGPRARLRAAAAGSAGGAVSAGAPWQGERAAGEAAKPRRVWEALPWRGANCPWAWPPAHLSRQRPEHPGRPHAAGAHWGRCLDPNERGRCTEHGAPLPAEPQPRSAARKGSPGRDSSPPRPGSVEHRRPRVPQPSRLLPGWELLGSEGADFPSLGGARGGRGGPWRREDCSLARPRKRPAPRPEARPGSGGVVWAAGGAAPLRARARSGRGFRSRPPPPGRACAVHHLPQRLLGGATRA